MNYPGTAEVTERSDLSSMMITGIFEEQTDFARILDETVLKGSTNFKQTIKSSELLLPETAEVTERLNLP